MNYVSREMMKHAAQVMEALERFEVEHPEVPGGLVCNWQSDPSSAPCGERAEYFVADASRVSAGGDIETAPQWYCREHLEHELGEAPRDQPIFGRIQGFEGEE